MNRVILYISVFILLFNLPIISIGQDGVVITRLGDEIEMTGSLDSSFYMVETAMLNIADGGAFSTSPGAELLILNNGETNILPGTEFEAGSNIRIMNDKARLKFYTLNSQVPFSIVDVPSEFGITTLFNSSELQYKVTNMDRGEAEVVASNTVDTYVKMSKYGSIRNTYLVHLTNLQSGIYMLEVDDNSGNKHYLLFENE